jgi:hypothetical protein
MRTDVDGMAIASPSRFTVLFGASTEDGAGGQFERVARGPAQFGARHTVTAHFGSGVFDLSFVGQTTRVLYRADGPGVRLAERVRGPGGHYGGERRVYQGTGPGLLQVFTDRRGGQVALLGGDHALTRRAGHKFKAQRIPHVGDASLPMLAAASNGAAAMVWPVQADGTVRVATRQPGRRFGTPRVISRQRKAPEEPYAIAVDRAGRATVLWSGLGPHQLAVVTTTRTGERASVDTILGAPATVLAFARDDRGRGTIAWCCAGGPVWAAYGS